MTTETKHTPGTWIILQQGKKVFIQGRNNSAYFSIAEVAGPNNNTVQSINERIANIKLIASAPELLEACNEITGLIAYASQSESYKQAAYGLLLGILPKIRKAILKAEQGK